MPAKSKYWLLVVSLMVGLGLLGPGNDVLAQKRTQTTRKRTTQTTRRRTNQPKSKAQLERERLATLRRIRETSRILEQTQRQKEASLGQLNALKEKLTYAPSRTCTYYQDVDTAFRYHVGRLPWLSR